MQNILIILRYTLEIHKMHQATLLIIGPCDVVLDRPVMILFRNSALLPHPRLDFPAPHESTLWRKHFSQGEIKDPLNIKFPNPAGARFTRGNPTAWTPCALSASAALSDPQWSQMHSKSCSPLLFNTLSAPAYSETLDLRGMCSMSAKWKRSRPLCAWCKRTCCLSEHKNSCYIAPYI